MMTLKMIDSSYDRTGTQEIVCLTLAMALHGLMLYWNPMIMHSEFQTHQDRLVEVEIQQGADELPPAPAQPAPRQSLMKSLIAMMTQPKSEEIAHVAPPAQTPQAAAPVQPALREKNASHAITPTFKPVSQTEDLASASAPNAIQTPTRNVATPNTAPSLKAKSFGGIRAKDLPFQMGADESLAGSNANVIPVAIGQKSAQAALGYSNPALQDSGRHRMDALTQRLGSQSSDLSAVGSSPATIQLSGANGSGRALTTQGSALQNRAGSGSGAALVSRNTYGSSGGTIGRGIQGIPSAAADLDQKLAASATTSLPGKQTKKGFDIAGPLGNRPIVHKIIPQYPSWAEEQGIIGSVRIYFTVTPEGTVRSNMQIRKTTGYPELDKLAFEALSQWKFAPFDSSDESSQWGIITFTFSLAS